MLWNERNKYTWMIETFKLAHMRSNNKFSAKHCYRYECVAETKEVVCRWWKANEMHNKERKWYSITYMHCRALFSLAFRRWLLHFVHWFSSLIRTAGPSLSSVVVVIEMDNKKSHFIIFIWSHNSTLSTLVSISLLTPQMNVQRSTSHIQFFSLSLFGNKRFLVDIYSKAQYAMHKTAGMPFCKRCEEKRKTKHRKQASRSFSRVLDKIAKSYMCRRALLIIKLI